MTQVRGDETFSNSAFSPNPLIEEKWKSSQAVPAFPAIFQKLSKQISPHVKVHNPFKQNYFNDVFIPSPSHLVAFPEETGHADTE